MKPIFCAILTIVLLSLLGCESSRDLTSNPGTRTDYVAGRVYTLKKPVFLFKFQKDDRKEIPTLERLGASGTPLDLADFKRQAASNPQVAGMLMPGDRIKVTRFVEEKSMTMGNFLRVYAIILSGEHANTEVELSMISKDRRPSYNTLIDPEYLDAQK